jgi:AraC-like DNA-binding protein
MIRTGGNQEAFAGWNDSGASRGAAPIAGATHSFSQRDAPFFDKVHYSLDGLVRSVRLIDPGPFVVEMAVSVGLTVHAGAGFHTRRKSGTQIFAGPAAPGRSFLNGPGDLFKLELVGDCRSIQLNLPVHLFERFLLEDHDLSGGLSALRPPHGAIDPELLRLAGWALLARQDMRELAIRSVVARLATAHGTSSGGLRTRGLSPATLRRVQDFVEAHLDSVSLKTMAREARLSVFHFAREFKRETGQTPWAFVVLRRVWRAAELLAMGERTEDIAQRTGFADASHMRRSFRKVIGATPAAVIGRLLP